MTITAQIIPMLPARVESGAGIAASLSGGVLTVGLDYRNLPESGIVPVGDYRIAVQNTTTGEFEAVPPTAWARPLGLVPSLPEYASVTDAIDTITTSGGGVLHIPAGASPTLPASFPSVLLDYDGSATPVSVFAYSGGVPAVAKKVWRAQDAGGHANVQHYSNFIEHRPVGSGKNGPASMDGGLGISVIKKNWTDPALAIGGEIDGLYINVYNGGPMAPSNDPGSSDGSGILIGANVLGYCGFITAIEANIHQVAPGTFNYLRSMATASGSIIANGNGIDGTPYGGMAYGHIVTATTGVIDYGYFAQTADAVTSALSFPFAYQRAGLGRVWAVNGNGQMEMSSPTGTNPCRLQNNNGTLVWADGVTNAPLFSATGSAILLGADIVLKSRQTGWTAGTGTANKGAFNAATATAAETAARVLALEQALRYHGQIN